MIDGFSLIVLIIIALCCMMMVAHFWTSSPETAFREYVRHCEAAGMSAPEIMESVAIRRAAAELRRRASDECVSRGGDMPREKINEIAKDIASGLNAVYGKEAAKKFLEWIAQCRDREILYDDARAAEKAFLKANMRMTPLVEDRDLQNAFKIIK